MIVSGLPRQARAWRGVVASVSLVLLWDVAVTIFAKSEHTGFDGIQIQFTLFGSAIALFIGFVVNAAYARWWEARGLWGQVVNSSRSLARQVLVLVDEPPEGEPGDTHSRMIRSQVAYAHVLRTHLRRQPLPPEAADHLDPGTLERVTGVANVPAAILLAIDEMITGAARRGTLGELSRLTMEQTLVALTDAQGGLERIRNTPLPVQYRVMAVLFARLFCLILPFAVVADLGWATPVGSGLVSLMFLAAVQIGRQLAEPFADGVYDVPMTALCRTIEIDLLETIDQEPRRQVVPVDRVLW